jgi:hypothetical protein
MPDAHRWLPGCLQHPKHASRHDNDNDNYNMLDLAEAKAMAGVHFDELNKDSDTALETEEVKAVVGESLFRAADTDHDGSLSKDEYLALVQKLFKKADIDHIGTLRASELRSKAGSALRKLIGCWVRSGERLSVSSKRPPATTSTTGHLRLRSSAISYSLPWRSLPDSIFAQPSPRGEASQASEISGRSSPSRPLS